MLDFRTAQKPAWLSGSQVTPSKVWTSILTALLPSFLIPLFKLPKPKNLHGPSGKIATLDGLRGVSCWAVFNHHWCDIISDAYGPSAAVSNQTWYSHYPIIAIVWQGTSQVYVFFVLSGYVLSARLIKQIHRRQWDAFQKSISSAIFRRAPRMFLPAIISLIFYGIVIQCGGFNQAQSVYKTQVAKKTMQVKMGEPMPPIAQNVTDQIANIFTATLTMLDPTGDIFAYDRFMWYSGHLWTIPVEFYNSIAMFIVMLGASRLRPIWRLISVFSLACWCWWAFHLYLFLFLSGMIIAELDIIMENYQTKKRLGETNSPLQPVRCSTAYSGADVRKCCGRIPYVTLIRAFALFLGIWMLSMPKAGGELTPGFMIFFKMMPGKRSILDGHDAARAIGAVLTVWPISNVSVLAREDECDDSGRTSVWSRLTFHKCVSAILANPVSIYAGRISFGFYLLHGLFIKSVGYALTPTFYQKVVVEPRTKANIPIKDPLTRGQVVMLIMLGYLCIFPMLVWSSDLFTRYVDDKCIAFARNIERFMLIRDKTDTVPVTIPAETVEEEKDVRVNGYALVRQQEQA